jgi:hypothetical protein
MMVIKTDAGIVTYAEIEESTAVCSQRRLQRIFPFDTTKTGRQLTHSTRRHARTRYYGFDNKLWQGILGAAAYGTHIDSYKDTLQNIREQR